MSGRRHANLTLTARRLTPAEVVRDWFRRGADYDFRADHPTFPKPGPDGLYLGEQVEDWFRAFHGVKRLQVVGSAAGQDAIMRHARGER